MSDLDDWFAGHSVYDFDQSDESDQDSIDDFTKSTIPTAPAGGPGPLILEISSRKERPPR